METKTKHRYEVGDTVRCAKVFPLPGNGRRMAQDVTGVIDDVRIGSKSASPGYVIAVPTSDGPFASRWYGVAFDRDCEGS